MSDEPLSVCPSCGMTGYAKQLSAAGFQLRARAGTPPTWGRSQERPGGRIHALACDRRLRRGGCASPPSGPTHLAAAGRGAADASTARGGQETRKT